MLDTTEGLGRWRTQGIYDIAVAHRLTGVSTNSIKRWLEEYPAHVAELKPDWKDLWGRIHTQHNRLSFLEMVEVLIAGKIRAGQGGSYWKVRKYHDELAAEWGTQFPFAHQNLAAHIEGLPIPAVKALEQLDYEDGFASRWLSLWKRRRIGTGSTSRRRPASDQGQTFAGSGYFRPVSSWVHH